MVLDRVALTGASGMVGRHILSLLAEEGRGVLASSRREPPGFPALAASGAWRAWDLSVWLEPEELDRIFPGATAIVHAGAAIPALSDQHLDRTIFDVDVRSCLCLGRWALQRGIPLVFISSSTVYAEPEVAGIRENAEKTDGTGLGGGYSYGKLLAEQVLSYLARQGLSACILRPSSVYGTGLPEGKLVAKLLAAAGRGETIPLRPPVEDRVNLLHARDLASAALDALRAGAHGEFNIAGTATTSVRGLADACVAAAGKGAVAAAVSPAGTSAKTRFDLDTGAARVAFGYRPAIGLSDGLARMVAGLY